MAGVLTSIRCSDCATRVTLNAEQSETLVRRLKVTFHCPGCRDERTYSMVTKRDFSSYDVSSFEDPAPAAPPIESASPLPIRNAKPKPPPFVAAAPSPAAPPWEPPSYQDEEPDDAPPPFDRPNDYPEAAFPHPELAGPSEATPSGGLRGRWSRLSNGMQLILLGGAVAAAAAVVLIAPWESGEAPLVLDFFPADSADAPALRTASTSATAATGRP